MYERVHAARDTHPAEQEGDEVHEAEEVAQLVDARVRSTLGCRPRCDSANLRPRRGGSCNAD